MENDSSPERRQIEKEKSIHPSILVNIHEALREIEKKKERKKEREKEGRREGWKEGWKEGNKRGKKGKERKDIMMNYLGYDDGRKN